MPAQLAQARLARLADVLAVEQDLARRGSMRRVRQRMSVDLPEPERP